MKTATLSQAMPVDKPVASLKITSMTVDFVGQTLTANVSLIDASGAQVTQRPIVLSSPAVKTWIGKQEETLLNALMTKLGVAGTIA